MRHNYSTTDEDAMMILRIKDNDGKAFDFLFRKYYRSLCSFISRFIAYDEVEDVAADCLMWFWEHRSAMNISCFRTYLFGMAYHRCLRIIDRKRISREISECMAAYAEHYDVSAAMVLEQTELRERIEKAISELPEKYRDAFLQHRFDGRTYKEIAETSGISAKTVDYRIGQALKILRFKLGGDIPLILVLIVMTATYGNKEGDGPVGSPPSGSYSESIIALV